MAEKKTEEPPEGWKELRSGDSPDGPPTVGFDPKSRRNFHIETVTRGVPTVIWHGVPEGYHFDAKGALSPSRGTEQADAETKAPKPQPAPESPPPPDQIVGTPEQPASIPLSGEGEVARG